MPAFTATAPGKIILFGEHAVVYRRAAIAVPISQVRARATVIPLPGRKSGEVHIIAKDIGLESELAHLPENHPLGLAINVVCEKLGVAVLPAMRLKISSTVPIAAGLGSGAAVSAAIARALSAFLGHPLDDADISAVAFRVDQQLHSNPSGIDNTVIAYTQPIFFVRDQPFQRLRPCQDFTVVIGNTGVASPTGTVVEDVRRRWQIDQAHYEILFDEINKIAQQARLIIENGPIIELGPLMSQNHSLLQQLDVSSPALDMLVQAALKAGANGAKLCGGGRGGNMIALTQPNQAGGVADALREAGAVNTIISSITS